MVTQRKLEVVKIWQKANPDKVKLYQKISRERHKEQRREYNKKWAKTHVTPEYRKKHRGKPNIFRKAIRRKIGYLIEKGKIERPEYCSVCNSKENKIEAHHEDYSKPLEIIFLCKSCHSKRFRR